MSSKCSDVGNVKERRDGPARESLASSLGEGREPDGRRGGGRGVLRESVEGGMTGCLLSTSPSALSVCSGSAREKADRKTDQWERAIRRVWREVRLVRPGV